MNSKRLTDNDLSAIEARAEALGTLNGTLSRIKRLSDPDWRLGVISGNVAYPLDGDYAEIAWRFVEHAQDDVPRLLAHTDAQDDQIAGLSGALRAVKDELQLLIDGAQGRGYFLPSPGISNMQAIVYAIDQALERNGATYE